MSMHTGRNSDPIGTASVRLHAPPADSARGAAPCVRSSSEWCASEAHSWLHAARPSLATSRESSQWPWRK
eukprot:149096-Prymnesium_polylepis.1